MNCQTLLIGILKASFLNKHNLFVSFLTTLGSSSISSLDLWILYLLSGSLYCFNLIDQLDSVKYRSKVFTFLAKSMERKQLDADLVRKSIIGESDPLFFLIFLSPFYNIRPDFFSLPSAFTILVIFQSNRPVWSYFHTWILDVSITL